MKKEFLQPIKVIFLGVLLSIGISYVSAAWNAPTSGPTANNTEPPITVSSLRQTKFAGVNFKTGISVGKETDPALPNPNWQIKDSNVPTLDVVGHSSIAGTLSVKEIITAGAGLIVKGAASFSPYGNTLDDNGAIFKVLDNKQDPTKPVFFVNTALTGTIPTPTTVPGIWTKYFWASENATFEKNLNVGTDLDVGNDVSVTNNLLTGKDVFVGDNLKVTHNANIVGDLAIGYAGEGFLNGNSIYDLYLNGTTNIGRGSTCYLNKSLSDSKGCPEGSYLQRINSNAGTNSTDQYAICKAFNPTGLLSTSGEGSVCYNNLSPLKINFSSISWGYQTSECSPQVSAAINISSGESPYNSGSGKIRWFTVLNGGAPQDYVSCANSYTCTAINSVSRQFKGFTYSLGVEVTDSAAQKATIMQSKKYAQKFGC